MWEPSGIYSRYLIFEEFALMTFAYKLYLKYIWRSGFFNRYPRAKKNACQKFFLAITKSIHPTFCLDKDYISLRSFVQTKVEIMPTKIHWVEIPQPSLQLPPPVYANGFNATFHCYSGNPGLLLTKATTRPFMGYKGAREMTEKKFIRNVKTVGDVYVNTGDLLKIDEDGNISFIDRLGDTFRLD